MNIKPGATLADAKGECRARRLDKGCVNVQLQILERQRNTLAMAEDAATSRGPWEEDPKRMSAMVDRQDKGIMSKEKWLQ